MSESSRDLFLLSECRRQALWPNFCCRPKSDRVSPSEGHESGRRKLPQPVKVGHPGRANKAVPAGWIRRIVDARFAMQ